MCDLINLKSGNWSGKYHNRLVRDNIPDICISNNQKSKFRELDDLKYVSALNEELKEETKEYLADSPL